MSRPAASMYMRFLSFVARTPVSGARSAVGRGATGAADGGSGPSRTVWPGWEKRSGEPPSPDSRAGSVPTPSVSPCPSGSASVSRACLTQLRIVDSAGPYSRARDATLRPSLASSTIFSFNSVGYFTVHLLDCPER